MLTNAAGATPRGSQVEAMLERFIQELADAIGEPNPYPEKPTPDDFDATFASLLGRVAVKRRVVVVLDALNQFDATMRAQHLTWLRAKQWHANVRLIATALPGQPADALLKWTGIVKLDVPTLTNTGEVSFQSDDGNGENAVASPARKLTISDDVDAIAQAVWARYHRAVNPAVLHILKQKRLTDGSLAAGNPLWLTLALEQINLLDSDDFARAERDFTGSSGERLRAMQIDTAQRMPPTVAELYGWLLAQTEKIFGVAPARAFAAVIAVSHFGWRESDLLKLIPAAARLLCPDTPELQLDDLQLATLRRSFRAHVVRRGALEQLDFFHAQMREAVLQYSLQTPGRTPALHRVIADHLESLPDEAPLRINELMVHLISGNDPARAARVLADLIAPFGVPTAATQVLAQHVLTGNSDTRCARSAWVMTLLTQPGLTNQQVVNLVNRFIFDLHDALANTADLATRQSLLHATRIAQQRLAESDPTNVEWQPDLSESFIKLGELATAQGNLPEAQRLFGEAFRIAQRLAESDPANAGWQRDLSLSFNKLGDLARAQGNLPRPSGSSVSITASCSIWPSSTRPTPRGSTTSRCRLEDSVICP